MPTAILIDGGFFLRRYRILKGNNTPKGVARDLHWMCREHLKPKGDASGRGGNVRKLYRIFYYDCPPLSKKTHRPISKQSIDYSKTPTALWRLAFHDELRKQRKVAIRLGYLNERFGHWEIRERPMKSLLAGNTTFADLTDEDFTYEVAQKGVDMRIGLDIASMAFKKQVDQIVLVAGDSDFVPAAKLARREGIDFVLDPMWANIRHDLDEHIDGLRSVFRRDDEGLQANRNPQSSVPQQSKIATDDDTTQPSQQ